jgi:cobalt-zinc-cadmium efflux system outer membrane protein
MNPIDRNSGACPHSGASFAAFTLGLLLCVADTAWPDGSPDPRPLGAELATYQAPADPNAKATVEPEAQPGGPLVLGTALRAALSHNPTLAAFSWEVRARDAEVLQAGARPNPEAATEVEDFAGSGDRHGFSGSQTTLSFAQLIELGGKREKRVRVAALDRELAGWDYEAARLAVFTETTQRFVRTLALQERIALATEIVGLAEKSLTTVRATVSAGATSQVEASRAMVAVEQARIALTKLEHDLEASRAALAASWGADSATFGRAEGNLQAISPPPPFSTLAALVDENPDLARWNTEIAQRKAALANEQAKRIPDVTISVGPRYYADNSSGGLVAGFSVPLPLFNKNSGAIVSAENRVRRAEAEQAAAHSSVNAELRSVYEELSAAHSEVEALRKHALPAAEAAYSGAMKAYQAGRFRYLEVLDSQRTLFEIKVAEIEALASYHRAAASLERLTGNPLNSRSIPRNKR